MWGISGGECPPSSLVLLGLRPPSFKELHQDSLHKPENEGGRRPGITRESVIIIHTYINVYSVAGVFGRPEGWSHSSINPSPGVGFVTYL